VSVSLPAFVVFPSVCVCVSELVICLPVKIINITFVFVGHKIRPVVAVVGIGSAFEEQASEGLSTPVCRFLASSVSWPSAVSKVKRRIMCLSDKKNASLFRVTYIKT